MSTQDSNNGPTDSTADPMSGSTPDPTAEPLTDPVTDPMTDPVTEPTPQPGATIEIPSTSTRALPAQPPFRVEPSSPVPDDVVVPGSGLPHLPPPASPSQPGFPPAQESARQPAPQPAPRPALVTVNRGPRPGSIMLGLLTVLVAAYLLLANLTHSELGFRVTGASFIGALGGILLLVGLAGVVAGRLRRH